MNFRKFPHPAERPISRLRAHRCGTPSSSFGSYQTFGMPYMAIAKQESGIEIVLSDAVNRVCGTGAILFSTALLISFNAVRDRRDVS
jgi:hypothetical protein